MQGCMDKVAKVCKIVLNHKKVLLSAGNFRKKYNKSRVFCVYPVDKPVYNKTIERNRSVRLLQIKRRRKLT